MSKELYLSGTSKYASVNKLDNFGKYTVMLLINTDDMHKFQQSGSQASVKMTEEGPVVTFRRTPVRLKADGTQIEFGPPKVYDKHGEETNYFIQSGERITVKLGLYDTVKGVGTTLDAVILNDREGKYVPKAEDNEYDGVRV